MALALAWVCVFWKHAGTTVSRSFYLDELPADLVIIVDASPWGLGAVGATPNNLVEAEMLRRAGLGLRGRWQRRECKALLRRPLSQAGPCRGPDAGLAGWYREPDGAWLRRILI